MEPRTPPPPSGPPCSHARFVTGALHASHALSPAGVMRGLYGIAWRCVGRKFWNIRRHVTGPQRSASPWAVLALTVIGLPPTAAHANRHWAMPMPATQTCVPVPMTTITPTPTPWLRGGPLVVHNATHPHSAARSISTREALERNCASTKHNPMPGTESNSWQTAPTPIPPHPHPPQPTTHKQVHRKDMALTTDSYQPAFMGAQPPARPFLLLSCGTQVESYFFCHYPPPPPPAPVETPPPERATVPQPREERSPNNWGGRHAQGP